MSPISTTTTTSYVLVLALALFASLSPLPAAAADVILDTRGNPVLNGQAYEVYTSVGYVGRVLKDHTDPCSGSYVAQRVDRKRPEPLGLAQFTLPALVPVSAATNLYVSFLTMPCPSHEGAAWRLVPGENGGGHVVDTSGFLVDDASRFKVEKADTGSPFDYKFVSCPNPDDPALPCADISVTPNGILGLHGDPLVVRFAPASNGAAGRVNIHRHHPYAS